MSRAAAVSRLTAIAAPVHLLPWTVRPLPGLAHGSLGAVPQTPQCIRSCAYTAITLLADTASRSQADAAGMIRLAQQFDLQITQRVADGGVFRSPLAEPWRSPAAKRSDGDEREADQ